MSKLKKISKQISKMQTKLSEMLDRLDSPVFNSKKFGTRRPVTKISTIQSKLTRKK
jgi:hypothetical protein